MTQLRELVESVRDAVENGIEEVRERDEAKIRIAFEDDAGDRYPRLTDQQGIERRLRVQRIVVVLEPIP